MHHTTPRFQEQKTAPRVEEKAHSKLHRVRRRLRLRAAVRLLLSLLLHTVLEHDPGNIDATIALAELYSDRNEKSRALELLQTLGLPMT